MIDTSMYGRIGGFDQGLRMGQAIGGVFTTARNTGLRDKALERIKAGEDAIAVAQEVMQQSPEVAQELLNLNAAKTKFRADDLAMQQQEQQIRIGNENLSRSKLQQSAMPMLGALMVDNADARKKLLEEAAQPFRESNPAVFDTIMEIGNQPEEVQANAISGIIKTLRQAGVYPDDPSQMMGQGTALAQNLALLDQAKQAGDTERAELIRRNIDPSARAMSQAEADLQRQQALNPVLTERTGMQEEAKLREQAEAKRRETQAKNQTAFAAYDQALSSVKEFAGRAGSGVFGLAPAVFADDRLFDGAIAILRPNIKTLTREAGEGTFTEGDQALLDQMFPTRVDSPEVRMMKLQMLDNFIRTKLGQPLSEQQNQQGQQPFLPQQEQPGQQPQQPPAQFKIIEVR